MRSDLPKAYNPADHEESIYTLWEDSGFFNPDVCIEKGVTDNDAEAFSIVLPPPNVTGVLHMGHAFEHTIQDAIVRFHRMRGYKTLWVPGTDHAAIATQTKVESILYDEENKTKHDLGRDAFLERVEQFAAESHDTIVGQMRKMGASVDWSREAFTLDEPRQEAVFTAFKTMYDEKLIYRGGRIVNWDPKLQTTVSDDEVERVEKTSPFYYLQYGPFEIATARPETKFGDKYVVMHPEDTRYKKYKHGQTIDLEWINGPITATIIKDEAVDPEFGTGVMTITPWHDTTDFEIAERHNLDREQIIDYDGNLLPIAKDFAGMPISKARSKIVERLQEKGLVTRIDEDYTNNIAINSRGGGLIEPQIMEQWFVDVTKEFPMPHSEIDGIQEGNTVTLKKLMRHVIEKKLITIIPDRFEKTYFHWIDNLRDWCISRQLWYGHRIPVWYNGNETVISKDSPGDEWTQDTDTLDTWFSSGLWTFSTLGWPEETDDLHIYHPTTVIMPGYEIIFFWVARMILMSTYLLGEIPFRTVYLHGMVRDKKGEKFSKSLGTGIDPLDIAQEFGVDALRMALIVGVGPGNDSNFNVEKVKGYKHFANKLWNATRFVLMNLSDDFSYDKQPDLTSTQKEHLKSLNNIINSVTTSIENNQLHIASEDLYHYFWHTFADVMIETEKEALHNGTPKAQHQSAWTLYHILRSLLIMTHPFMPFVTEALWSTLPEQGLIMVTSWPADQQQ